MSDIRIDERNQTVKEKISDEEMEKVVGGIAGFDDFINWLTEKAGAYLKKKLLG